jgi:phage terminase large subunit-like protein
MAAREPICDRCGEQGEHLCEPRAAHAVEFVERICKHTKGRFARTPFVLEPWQRDEIVRPLFGTVRYEADLGTYVRRYRIAWVELARKNGKSELLAALALLLLCADDEEGAEIYGAAKDRDQARKVFDVALRMVQLSPILSKRLKLVPHAKRIVDEKTNSVYEVVAADAAGNLGHNPHGVIFDEVLTQPSADLWDALRTGMGTRTQPLMIAATTAGNDPASFAAKEHDYCLRVQRDPRLDPSRFVYCRNVPDDADPWDESNWSISNPALGSFLSLSALREEALEARNDPTKENSFRQYRLNQWVRQVTRWIPLHLWDASAGLVDPTDLEGEACYAGLDLASTTDLASWVLLFPRDDDRFDVLFRFYTPEAQLPALDTYTGGRASVWVREGLLTATEGDWIDYETIHRDIERDAARFRIVKVGYDQREATATAQHMQRLGLTVEVVHQGYSLSGTLKELLRLVKLGGVQHGGNPVARWNADSVEVRRDDSDRIKIVKPDRGRNSKRIDGIAALANALNVWQFDTAEPVDLAASVW